MNNFMKYFDVAYVGNEVDAYYQKWVQYRQDAVTAFVKRVKDEVKDALNADVTRENDILLSTAVFSSSKESLNSKKQDWQTWFKNGWIDIATPMAYFTAAADVQEGVTNMIWAAGNKCYYYTKK